MTGQTYSSPEVCHMTGVTYRQLDYWCRTWMIPGQDGGDDGVGSGRRRVFTDAQVDRVRRIALVSRIRNAPLDEAIELLGDVQPLVRSRETPPKTTSEIDEFSVDKAKAHLDALKAAR